MVLGTYHKVGKIQSCNITFFMLCFGMHENSSGCEMQCELFHFYTVQFFVQVRRLALIILFSEKLLFFDDYFFIPKLAIGKRFTIYPNGQLGCLVSNLGIQN